MFCFISFSDVPQAMIAKLQRSMKIVWLVVLKVDILAVQIKMSQLIFKDHHSKILPARHISMTMNIIIQMQLKIVQLLFKQQILLLLVSLTNF